MQLPLASFPSELDCKIIFTASLIVAILCSLYNNIIIIIASLYHSQLKEKPTYKAQIELSGYIIITSFIRLAHNNVHLAKSKKDNTHNGY